METPGPSPRPERMQLKVLLPFQVFAEVGEVTRVVAETPAGSFGFWPHRLDCVAALVPGILTYAREGEAESYFAVDEGVLIKSGLQVLVSVRNAFAGSDLRRLHAEVEQTFRHLDERERSVRAVLARMESGFMRRFAELHRA